MLIGFMHRPPSTRWRDFQAIRLPRHKDKRTGKSGGELTPNTADKSSVNERQGMLPVTLRKFAGIENQAVLIRLGNAPRQPLRP